MDDKKYWIGFNFVKGIGSVRLTALLEYFGDLSIAWNAPADGLQSAGLHPRIIENLNKVRSSINLDKVIEYLQEQEITVLTWGNPDYPRLLNEIDQSPPVLFVRGKILADDDWAIAIVGSRKVTAYGKQVTEEMASGLAMNGITVISGLARGIDGVAHRAALNAGGRTIAVLGSGVDTIYPPEHRKLAEDILQNGAIISDYPPKTPPDSANFPPRNRIISGLSKAVVIVEAGVESGALITATYAAEQGREVFAVPGGIFSPQSKGTNNLIQQGARPYLDLRDVLEVLNISQVESKKAVQSSFPTDKIELQIINSISSEAVHIDDIQRATDLPIEQVSSTLTMLELKGWVKQTGNMMYICIRERNSFYGS